jgi:hypothetical protein
MEYDANAFLTQSWEPMIPNALTDFYEIESGFCDLDNFNENPLLSFPQNLLFSEVSLPLEQSMNCSSFSEFYYPEFTDSSNNNMFDDTPPFPSQEEYYSFPMLEDEDLMNINGVFGIGNSADSNMVFNQAPCKMEPVLQSVDQVPNFSMGVGEERKNKLKKSDGQPSKNLMAERRRRKRLNDRLSMLRSVVPKISKMDRTSILGDTIDYMKELLDRINNLNEDIEVGSNKLNSGTVFRNENFNGILLRNSPKFDVERRSMETRIEICCATKPSLLLSTLSTLEASGLEIQHCVISCFNDFAMQASCSEELEQREVLGDEEVKQALFRNAGYGGRCV